MKTYTKSKYFTKEDFLNIAIPEGQSLATQLDRAELIKFLQNNDLPSQKLEDWKKTSLNRILEHHYQPGEKIELDKVIVSMYNISGLYANILVFINGHFCSKLSRITDSDKVLVFDSMQQIKQWKPDVLYKYFNKTEAHKVHWFAAYNTAFAQDGAFILIKKDAVVENPIHVYFFSDGNNKKTISQTRNLIIAEKFSKANVLFSYHSLSSDFTFNNTVTEIFVEDSANLDFNIFQGEGNEASQINLINVHQTNNSYFHSLTATMCGRLVRNDLRIKFLGEGNTAELDGLYMPDREQFFDNTIFVHHFKPHNLSKQFYRGIIDNNAKSVFYGKVLIDKYATNSEAHQTNNNILLTPYAKAHSKPHLIIYNDDVAASHGSTVGQVDKNALFYMRTRGIGEKKAKTLLLTAFAEEVLQKIQIPQFLLYAKILVEKRLAGEKIENQCAKLGICRY